MVWIKLDNNGHVTEGKSKSGFQSESVKKIYDSTYHGGVAVIFGKDVESVVKGISAGDLIEYIERKEEEAFLRREELKLALAENRKSIVKKLHLDDGEDAAKTPARPVIQKQTP